MLVKAISIRQPWAWAIVTGRKPIENRSLRFPRRKGWVLIHAGKVSEPVDLGQPNQLPLGGFVGLAKIVDHVTTSDNEWFEGPLGLVMAMPMELPFYAYHGQLGLFNVHTDDLGDWGAMVDGLMRPVN